MENIWSYVFPERAAASLLPLEASRELRFLLEIYERNRTYQVALLASESASNIEFAGADAAVRELRERLAEPQKLWWTDLAQAELCINTVVGSDAIGARLRSWRRRMKEVVGESRYAEYMTGASLPNAARAVVEADLSQCIRATYYFYGAYGVAAYSRNLVTNSLLGYAAAVLVAIASVAMVLTLPPGHLPWLYLPLEQARPALEWMLAAAAVGVVGSVANVQRRLEDPRIDVDPFYRFVQTKADRLSIALVSPLLGAIFGALAYAFLRSKLIQGSVLPAFAPAGAPQDGVAASLLLIYGFIAGFAEQLVPDALTRIATRTLGATSTFVHAPPPSASTQPGNGVSKGCEAAARRPGSSTPYPRRVRARRIAIRRSRSYCASSSPDEAARLRSGAGAVGSRRSEGRFEGCPRRAVGKRPGRSAANEIGLARSRAAPAAGCTRVRTAPGIGILRHPIAEFAAECVGNDLVRVRRGGMRLIAWRYGGYGT